MSDEIQKADQIAFHFYTKLFYALHEARATEGPRPQAKVDKWFNLDTPDCDLFTRDAREPYKSVSLAQSGPPPLEIEVLLVVPELASNQVLVYAPPDAARVKVDPAHHFILLEKWTLSMDLYRSGRAAPEDVALPTIYKHGIVLFRSLYSLLRVLPAWKFHKRLKRRTGRSGNLSMQLRVRPQGAQEAEWDVLRFGEPPASAHLPLPVESHTFSPIPHRFGTFTLHAEYITTPHFQLDEREALLSSGFLHNDGQTAFVPTLERHKQRDSISGSNLNAPVASSPPRAVGMGRALSTGTSVGASTKDYNTSLAERFLIPTRVPTAGIGPSANTGSSALIPPPRPFPTMGSGAPTSSNPTTTNVHTLNQVPVSGLAMYRLRKESMNSSTSSLASARDPASRATATTPSPTTIPLANPGPGGTASLSSSPSSGVPIRRPSINPVHPFKSNTLSSASGSSPSMSIRQGVAGSPAGLGLGMPSSLGREVTIAPAGAGGHSRHTSFSSSGAQPSPIGSGGPGARPPPLVTSGSNASGIAGSPGGHAWPSPPGHATTFAPSSLGALASDRPRFGGAAARGVSTERDGDSERARDRRRSVQGVYGAGAGTVDPSYGAGAATEGQAVPVPMQPRRRFESSFGHRYTGSAGGSVGSGTSGGGTGASPNLQVGVLGGRVDSTPGSFHGSTEGSAPSGSSREAFSTRMSPHTSTHVFEEDKEISIFVQDIDDRKPLSGRAKERESSERGNRRHSLRGTTEGKPRALHDGSSPVDSAPYTTSPLEEATSPDQLSPAGPDMSPTAAAETAAYLSTSPQRGPMLTSEREIDERLRRMNEAFLRSLQGISEGSVRRKKPSAAPESTSATADPIPHPAPSTSSSTSAVPQNAIHDRTASARSGSTTSTATAIASVATVAPPSPTTLAIVPGARLGPAAFPSRPSALSEGEPYVPTAGLGLGLPARVRYTSTSSSMLGTSEGGGASQSQGSGEVIGRLELDGERRRWGYGYGPA